MIFVEWLAVLLLAGSGQHLALDLGCSLCSGPVTCTRAPAARRSAAGKQVCPPRGGSGVGQLWTHVPTWAWAHFCLEDRQQTRTRQHEVTHLWLWVIAKVTARGCYPESIRTWVNLVCLKKSPVASLVWGEI